MKKLAGYAMEENSLITLFATGIELILSLSDLAWGIYSVVWKKDQVLSVLVLQSDGHITQLIRSTVTSLV